MLEPAGPSEALAIAYIRLSGLAMFEVNKIKAREDAERAAQIAEQAGGDMALAWSWNFIAGSEMGLGRVTDGFRHMEDSYQAALKGGHDFQTGNAVFNALWMAAHLGLGREAQKWLERAAAGWAGRTGAWPVYIEALVVLLQAHVQPPCSFAPPALIPLRTTLHPLTHN